MLRSASVSGLFFGVIFLSKNISKYLDRPIAFSPILAKISGSVKAGLFLSQAIYWTNRSSTGDGVFWKTQEQWEEETCLTRKEQEGARARLKTLGILEEIKQGLPCRIFFKVNFDVLDELATEYLASRNKTLNNSTTLKAHQENSIVSDSPSVPRNLALDFPIEHYEGPSRIQKPQKSKNENNGYYLVEEVIQVFDFWKGTMGYPGAKFDAKRRDKIIKALKLGYTIQELMCAIRGCAQSPHHMGDNIQGVRYDSLGLILRDAEHIDKFIGINRSPPQPKSMAPPDVLHRAKIREKGINKINGSATGMQVIGDEDELFF